MTNLHGSTRPGIAPPVKVVELRSAREDVAGRTNLLEQIRRTNYAYLWTYAVNWIVALLLITSPALYRYKSLALSANDIVSGILILVFECLSFSPRLALLRWATAAVGFWLLLAPLIFWSPNPATYINDTVLGALTITFAVLVAGVPGRGEVREPGPDQPPGWTYNPSSWIRRWLGIALALVGFLISRYLAAHQLGYTTHAWDPFFGNGSDAVLTSKVSRSFPVSDAGLGAVAYIMEVLTGFMGDRARWRTAPWIVLMFALLVIPLGVTSIVLVITQPIIVHNWCGLCLVAACALLTSVPLAVHEVVAVGQFLLLTKKQDADFWSVFWYGGTIVGGGRTDPDRLNYSLMQRWIASVQGVTVPWTLALQAAIGIWLMARPDIVLSNVMAADCDHLLGAIALTIAAIATAEVTRTARFLNIITGLAIVGAAFISGSGSPLIVWNDAISGVLLVLLSLPRGEILESYGSWNRYIK